MKKASINQVVIVIKKNSKTAFNEAKKLYAWLDSRGINSYFFDRDVAEKLNGKTIPAENEIFNNIDLLISLGGDGTFLSAVKHIIDYNIPIFGVNIGTLGFLTEISLKEMYPSLLRVLDGDYKISCRSTFLASIKHPEKTNKYVVLNDVVVNKRALARIIKLELTVNNKVVTTYQSDGLIISTPTGSTAYSLSAGGPIVCPNVDCIVISPICSHTLTHRPIIAAGDSTIKVKLISESNDVQLTLDGQISDPLEFRNEVTIKKYKKKIKLIESFDKNYFEILRTKLHWGKRGEK